MAIFGNLGIGIGKQKRPQTMAEWQSVVDGLTRNERDKLWPGMHKDLIAATEMIDAGERTGAGLSGLWDSAKSAYSGVSAAPGIAGDAQSQQLSESVPATSIPLEGAASEQYIAIKDGPLGADMTDMSDEILATYDDIEAVWAMYTDVKPVITSGRDFHEDEPDSLHHKGRAIDVRANNISDEISQQIADTLQQRLGYKYYVDFEQPPGEPERDHIHIEYDPK